MADQQQSKGSPTKTILTAWLIAGTLDICGAMLWSYIAKLANHTGNPNPLDVLFGIGKMVMGNKLTTPGVLDNYSLVCIGLIVHYAIAFVWTMIYFWAWPKIKFLQGQLVIAGLCYGIFVWAVMTFGVVPLRLMMWPTYIPKNLWIGCGIIMLALGLPISFIIGNYYSKKASQTNI